MTLLIPYGKRSANLRPLTTPSPIHKQAHIMLILLLALLLLIGTQVLHMIRLELTMGRSIPDAGTVSEEMFTAFVKSDIMPHLEYGTILDAVGFWKGKQEQTKILYLEIPESDLSEMQPIFERIGAAYKKAFRQDAVLISQLQTNAIFQ